MPDRMPLTASLTEQVYRDLRADLLSCRIRPGERLKIADLAMQREVSAGAIREALSRLSSEGLVANEPQRGFRAAPISAKALRDLTQVRVMIEGACLSRAIEVGDLEWEANLVAVFHQLIRTAKQEAADPDRLSDRWSQIHESFHDALVAACDNPALQHIRRQLYAQSERYRRLSVPLAESARDLDAEHHGMLDAVLARDTERAIACMARHLETTTAILLEARLIPESDTIA